MRHIASATFALCLATASAVQAEGTGGAIVVELFTSQGCSACPPADDFFADLAKDPDVIPLALHVDYWDYIGWEDKFGDPQFTARQKAYARAAGSRMIYTPQLIVGGQDRVEGNKPAEVEALIRRHLATGRAVSLTAMRKGDKVMITAEAKSAFSTPVRVELVRYRPEETVLIESGENEGKTITYSNIVTSWQPLGDWSGAAPLTIEAPAPGDDKAVVIVQSQGPAAILAAARVD
ncbi:MAG: DUF1223 domain-containing protein [Cereibacter sphaeroides]|uniref:DUF1223 domain-containing protein n=1 Tax=Cereibacter sphaeroides TaxID=1063 RepID=A0A2W5SDI2_CERSP|nr:MAG: DUF1223 domain-containing protein [Cereibacter sphaeroides]